MALSQAVHVFAYGSNMLTGRIRERCPSANALGIAELHAHQLRWHKRSVDGSGKCDVVRRDGKGSIVHGVLYEIAQQEKSALDRAEGLGNGYAEKSVEVLASGAPHIATLYKATDIDRSLRPYTWYKDLIVAGAREHGLPAGYITTLDGTHATEDPDRERDARNRRILLPGAQP